jgi:hypothetical protein
MTVESRSEEGRLSRLAPYQSIRMQHAIARKQSIHKTMGPDAPLNLTIPENSISIASNRASKVITIKNARAAMAGKPTVAGLGTRCPRGRQRCCASTWRQSAQEVNRGSWTVRL